MQVSERNIHDPVPKNVSKYPIHQTYLTSDAEGNTNGVYKFKCPEVWSSARSGKKSIAIRSIRWLSKTIVLQFVIRFDIIVIVTPAHDGVPDVTRSDPYNFTYRNTIPSNMSVSDVLVDIRNEFEQWANAKSLNGYHLATYLNNDNKLIIRLLDSDDTKINFKITSVDDGNAGSKSFNVWLNQPLDYFPAEAKGLVYENVWDRTSPLNFHASFVPFDNYQYLGAIFDNWNKPIIYQDANSSPLFNVWITTDMKTPIHLLHEQFIFRFTFIIATNDQYHS